MAPRNIAAEAGKGSRTKVISTVTGKTLGRVEAAETPQKSVGAELALIVGAVKEVPRLTLSAGGRGGAEDAPGEGDGAQGTASVGAEVVSACALKAD